jgi:plastocyanin
MPRTATLFVLWTLSAWVGCGSSSNNPNDAGANVDATASGEGGTASDAGTALDAGRDAAASTDAGADAGSLSDAGADAAVSDAGSDASVPRMLNVTATDFQFSPSTLTASPGERLTVVLHNDGGSQHNIAFQLGTNDLVRINANVAPSETGSVTFTGPTKTGSYVFFCPVDDHRGLGMVGQLNVQ